jgi:dipeptidyl aminopeptidase/acylaminoacyl peptidase
LPDLLGEELGQRADLDRVVLVGHSAGGHLALWAASRRAVPVVSLAGVCDLGLAAQLRLSDGATQDLIGGEPEDHPDRYAAADPAALVPLQSPAVLVHGRADQNVPVELSRAYAERAAAAGADVRLVELPDAGHFDVIDPLSTAWPRVIEAIESMLSS